MSERIIDWPVNVMVSRSEGCAADAATPHATAATHSTATIPGA
jgi:hypothetical protein